MILVVSQTLSLLWWFEETRDSHYCTSTEWPSFELSGEALEKSIARGYEFPARIAGMALLLWLDAWMNHEPGSGLPQLKSHSSAWITNYSLENCWMHKHRASRRCFIYPRRYNQLNCNTAFHRADILSKSQSTASTQLIIRCVFVGKTTAGAEYSDAYNVLWNLRKPASVFVVAPLTASWQFPFPEPAMSGDAGQQYCCRHEAADTEWHHRAVLVDHNPAKDSAHAPAQPPVHTLQEAWWRQTNNRTGKRYKIKISTPQSALCVCVWTP